MQEQLKTLQEMLILSSSVTLNCKVTKIVRIVISVSDVTSVQLWNMWNTWLCQTEKCGHFPTGPIPLQSHLGLRSLFGLDINTWENLPPSKQWQSRDHGNCRILFELQWETPLCDPQITTVMRFWLFSSFCGNLRITSHSGVSHCTSKRILKLPRSRDCHRFGGV